MSVLSSQVILRFSARKLMDKDIFSKSDPILVLFEEVGLLNGCARWIERGRTEMISNCLNPEWATPIKLDYFFEERQKLKIEIYDIDNQSSRLDEQDFLGHIECDLAEIVSSGTYIKNINGPKDRCGTLTVNAEEVNEGSKEILQFDIEGENIDKKGLFGTNPFLNIYGSMDDGSRVLAHRTDVLHGTNPQWWTIAINCRSLCNGDKSREFEIECWSHKSNGSHNFIGACTSTVGDLLSRKGAMLSLISEHKRKKVGSNYKNSGTLKIKSPQLIIRNSFLDYIQGGIRAAHIVRPQNMTSPKIEFSVSVDFTQSNGAPHLPDSLHHLMGNRPTQYEVAIRAVLDICQHYNTNKKFEAFGFGAILPGTSAASHFFNLTLMPDPIVDYVGGVLQAYRFTLPKVRLYGPTNFAPTIERTAQKVAQWPRDGSKYQILLIITDGVITDMVKTKQAIINASTLPLSIIIIGVGGADFDRMEELDSDTQLLNHAGRVAERDIVQFVPLRDFVDNNDQYGRASERAMALLAKEVLAEVPLQLTSYMSKNGIIANPRQPEQSLPYPPSLDVSRAGSTSDSQAPPIGFMPPPPYSKEKSIENSAAAFGQLQL